MFTPDLLAGRRVAVAGAGEQMLAVLRGLGGEAHPLERLDGADDAPLEAWCAAHAPWHGVLVDVRGAVGAADESGLSAGLDVAWRAVRAVAVHGLIPGGQGGRIILIAPPPGAGPFAEAAAAGLENLARTLSVEWARHGITAVCLAPGDATADGELSALAAFVLSDAGGYLSGCRFDLGGR